MLGPPTEQCVDAHPPFLWWGPSCLLVFSGTGEDTKQPTEQITLAEQTSLSEVGLALYVLSWLTGR